MFDLNAFTESFYYVGIGLAAIFAVIFIIMSCVWLLNKIFGE